MTLNLDVWLNVISSISSPVASKKSQWDHVLGSNPLKNMNLKRNRDFQTEWGEATEVRGNQSDVAVSQEWSKVLRVDVRWEY